MAAELVFQVGGLDSAPSALDLSVSTSEDDELSVSIDPAEIAEFEEPIGSEVGRLETCGDGDAAHSDFSRAMGPLRGVVVVQDRKLAVGQGSAGGYRLRFPGMTWG